MLLVRREALILILTLTLTITQTHPDSSRPHEHIRQRYLAVGRTLGIAHGTTEATISKRVRVRASAMVRVWVRDTKDKGHYKTTNTIRQDNIRLDKTSLSQEQGQATSNEPIKYFPTKRLK
jgi:hypothetical protein